MQFYLDHNATTPMCEEAIEAMAQVQRFSFGNASSVHSHGAAAREKLEEARAGIAELIGCEPGELYFTSGGTEANNWAIHGILENYARCAVVYSGIEHKSILNAVENQIWNVPVHKILVREDGLVDLGNLHYTLRTLRERPAGGNCLVSIMLANNETGVIQRVSEAVSAVKPHALVHTDAVQAFGKIVVNAKVLGVDLMTISAHKLGGPKGIGALYVRDGVEIEPMIRGGHQEHDRRAGTENVAAAVGFHVAARRRHQVLDDYQERTLLHVRELVEALECLEDTWINGAGNVRLPNTVNIGFDGVNSDSLVLMLAHAGISVSNGSACEAGSVGGSHVLKAMGLTDESTENAIRFSFSDDLPDGAIAKIAAEVIEAVESLRGMIDIPL